MSSPSELTSIAKNNALIDFVISATATAGSGSGAATFDFFSFVISDDGCMTLATEVGTRSRSGRREIFARGVGTTFVFFPALVSIFKSHHTAIHDEAP